MTVELDEDLLKECTEEIKNLLFIRFWKQIKIAARGNIQEFLLERKQ